MFLYSIRRRLLSTATAMLSLSLLVAPALTAADNTAKSSLSIVGPWEISTLEPSRSGYLFLRMQVAEALVGTDLEGKAAPGLAERWEVSPDGLQWRFFLRPDARFHDGSPVTAESVAMNLQRALGQPGVLAMAPIASISAAAPREVNIALSQPYAMLPMLLAHSSAIILAPAAYNEKGQVRRMLGSGPYQLVRQTLPQQFELALSPHWRGRQPAIRHIHYLSVSRPETRALIAESHQADLVFGFDPASTQRLRHNPKVVMKEADLARTVTLKLNSGHRFLNNVETRQALSLAINRAGIAKGILRTPELAADQLLPPSITQWHQAGPEFPRLHSDLAQAKKLLAAQGWRPGTDGILHRNGERFSLALTTLPDRPELPIIATALQDQFRKLGIEVKVIVTNSSEIPLGHRTGKLEMGLVPRNFALVPDPFVTLNQDFKHGGGDWGAMNWQNGEVPALLEKIASETEPAAQARYRHDIMLALQQELPVIPVTWYRLPVAVHPQLQGVKVDPLEQSYYISDMVWSAQ
ncbi:ABC transporter substrate-binding protein [Methylobacillus flagellatus]|uniref:ABC transporter substrate-binding protein n=1 Tax=Methylobacillus flagellatus TaxID=405 RepID=UPI002853A22D|nr:ABC transporter substrate-binding protein [Methylobacillus flagellatus]MDR5172203.1 ABC transporter substrate-binding protein [Methylobacillus flagellatus]